MEKKQYAAIDVLKFVCALFVVTIHTAPLMDISIEMNFFITQVMARLAVPFFFIISGFFAFSHIDFTKSWRDEHNLQYIKKYLMRILKLYIIWTIIYLPFTIRDGMQDGLSIAFIIRYLRDFLLNGSYYHLWYLPGLILATSFVYFLWLRFGKKKTFITIVILYLIGSLYNIFSANYLDNSLIAFYDSIFMTTRNGLFFGSIFVFLGAVLVEFNGYFHKKTCLLAGGISFIAMVMEVYILKSLGFMHSLACMYLFLVPTIFFLFQYLLQLDMIYKPFYKTLRSMSLLIYVVHIIFVIMFNLLFPTWNSLTIYIGVIILSCIFAYGIIWGSKRYPILRNFY